jgi:ADP-ribose pyrophosphatase YjhB (NUDIX family)
MQPIVRPTARVLLIDESQRVLMFRHEGAFRIEETEGTSLWAPPGGGLEVDESYKDAAVREIREETGLEVPGVGPCVWTRQVIFTWADKQYDSRERFYVCRVANFGIDTSGQEEQERREMTDHRWRAIEEIRASDEIFVPRDLANCSHPCSGVNTLMSLLKSESE